MATFYIQLQDGLKKISGDLTKEGIIAALGYTPSDFSGEFNDIANNPFIHTPDNSGEFIITDEPGNIIGKVDSSGFSSIEFIAGEHKLTEKANLSDIPSLDGYAKTSDIPSLAGYATESWVSTEIVKAATSGKVDLTGYATETYVNEKVAEINIPSLDGYAKTEDIPSLDGYAKTADIPSLDGYATETYVGEKIAEIEIPSLDGYAKTSDIPSLDGYAKTSDIPSLDGYAKTEDIPSLEGYLKAEDLGDISLDGYATEQYVDDKVSNIKVPSIEHLATKDEVTEINFYDIHDNPVLNTEDGKLLFVDESGNIGLRLEEDALYVRDVIAGDHVLSSKADKIDLNGLATEEYVNTKLSSVTPNVELPVEDVKVNGESVITNKVANIDLSDYAKSSEIPSLDGYAKTSDIPSLDGYLKAEDIGDISLEGYATEQFVADKIAEIDIPETSQLATKDDIAEIDFYDIHNNPVLNTEDGKLLFVDEAGNIGLRLEQDNTLYVKDVVAGDHVLSNKADKIHYYTKSEVDELLSNYVSLEEVQRMIAAALGGAVPPTPEYPAVSTESIGEISEGNSIVIDETKLENGTYTLRYIDSNENVIDNFGEIASFEINN
jgi:hypothetical protein